VEGLGLQLLFPYLFMQLVPFFGYPANLANSLATGWKT